MSKGIDELPSDVEELIRQRSELLKRKREKEEQLASLLPGDVESLRLHRESLLAKKKVKEHELAQLLKKQQVLCGVKKSRRTKKELVQDWNTNAPMVHQSIVAETKRQYQELKKEHEEDRKLLKEQQKQIDTLLITMANRIDSLQFTVNVLLRHYGLETVPLTNTDYTSLFVPEDNDDSPESSIHSPLQEYSRGTSAYQENFAVHVGDREMHVEIGA
eukprot:TRINITY_DN2465_c0_g1_i8.p1 TRINITY_DN2465_c0_g1~~TRINITY_DN2465_c0_g1_i8.p1  ORF type:complete len:217 (-),score=55.58 TRINITY_DN2465_c0_g1_i8:376-1026(-)